MAELPVSRRAHTEAEPREFWSAAERYREVSSNAMYVSSRKLEYDVQWKLALDRVLALAIGEGLVAAAVLDLDYEVLAAAGALAANQLRELHASAVEKASRADLHRFVAGEIVHVVVRGRHVALCFPKKTVLVIAVLTVPSREQLRLVRDVQYALLELLPKRGALAGPPSSGAAGGSGSGPADLPLVEYGITVPRTRGKA